MTHAIQPFHLLVIALAGWLTASNRQSSTITSAHREEVDLCQEGAGLPPLFMSNLKNGSIRLHRRVLHLPGVDNTLS